MKTFNETYIKTLERIMTEGIETSPRGSLVREIIPGYFEINPQDNIITVPGVETNLGYAHEELQWYLAGDNRFDWSERIARIWSKFSDNGETVNSNYGHRFFGYHDEIDVNQWEWVKDKLTEDPDSRQALMNVNLPHDKENPTKDFPCTVYCQLFNRNGKLEWITNMRSNDAYLGLRNDVYCFTELQKQMSNELGIEPGKYKHFAGSLHIYEKDFDKVNKAIKTHKLGGQFELNY